MVDNTLSSSGLVDTRDQQDNPDVDVIESPTVVQEAHPRSQGLGTPLAVSTNTVTFPTMLATSVAGTNIRTEKILSMPTTEIQCLPGVSTSLDTSGSVDMSTKASNDDEIGKATNLSIDVPPLIPDAPESAGQAT